MTITQDTRGQFGHESTSMLPPGLVERVQARLATSHSEPTPAALAAAVRADGSGLVSDSELLRLLHLLQRELVGAGPLADLLADPETTDVVVNGPNDVRVDRGRGWERASVHFTDEHSVQRLARRLAAATGRRLDDAHPFVDGRLPDGTRLHAVLPPVAAAGCCLSLRVLRPVRFLLPELAESGALPGISLEVLSEVVAARLAFLVSGGTGSGKTTLLSALLAAAAPSDRIVTVEDAEELRPPHPHVLQLVSRQPNVEGVGAVDLRDLVRQALRMRPDRLVVGEVRGAEVADLLQALNTGHEGGAGTVHANTVADVPTRIQSLAALGGIDAAVAAEQLAGAIQVLIHTERTEHGRTVSAIGLLARPAPGQVETVVAVRSGQPVEPGASRLRDLMASRQVAASW